MALAVGNRVRPKLSSLTLSANRLNPQPPVLAVVTDIQTGPPDLIFGTVADNGFTWTTNPSALSPNGVDSSSLDVIAPPDDTVRNALIDKVAVGLKADGETTYSQEFIGIIVDVYVVNGAPSVLIRSTARGFFYELPITRISLAPNR